MNERKNERTNERDEEKGKNKMKLKKGSIRLFKCAEGCTQQWVSTEEKSSCPTCGGDARQVRKKFTVERRLRETITATGKKEVR